MNTGPPYARVKAAAAHLGWVARSVDGRVEIHTPEVTITAESATGYSDPWEALTDLSDAIAKVVDGAEGTT